MTEHGFAGLLVSLFGADSLPDSPESIPPEMFEKRGFCRLHCLARKVK